MALLDLQAMKVSKAPAAAAGNSGVSVMLCPNSSASAQVCNESALSVVLCS